MFIDIKEAHV